MGRGRAKAKQRKVARDLKYRPVDPDFKYLERELRGESYDSSESADESEAFEIPEAYVDLAEQYNGNGEPEDRD